MTETTTTADTRRTPISFAQKKFRAGEFVVEKAVMATAFVSLAFIVLIFIFVFREAAPAVFGVAAPHAAIHDASTYETYGEPQYETYGESAEETGHDIPADDIYREAAEPQGRRQLWRNVFGFQWQPVSLQPQYGIWPLVIGSVKLALIAIVISAPIAVFAALFSAMFAPRWMKEVIKPIVEILAGFPSVVIGFFVLIVLATYMQRLFGFEYRLNALVGGAALSLAIIPVIFTITEDALTAVPRSLVEASLALGAAQWETALFVVLPAATPGIFAAILLGVGRAIGETMIALMVTGNAALISLDPALPVRTMSAAIGAEMAEVVFGDIHYTVLFLLGVLLFLFSFGINLTAEVFIRQRLMKRFKGA